MPQSEFRILPVIDLMGGRVVHGVGGHRAQYAPVASCLTVDSTPHSVAKAFSDRFALSELYVADLDAISGGEPDWDSLDQIADNGVRIWLDGGINSVETANHFRRAIHARPYLAALIVGLESIRSGSDLASICSSIGRQRAVFSLDLQDGRPLTSVPDLADAAPLDLARIAWRSGFRRMIILDLAFVGVDRGVGVCQLCQQLRVFAPSVELLAGGGIRTTADIRLLANAGCNGVLVASALHRGEILPSQLADFQRQIL